MSIKAPGWCSGAQPTLRGWEDPNSGELLVSARHTQDQIDAFHGVPSIPEVKTIKPTPPPPPITIDEPAAEEDALDAGYTDDEGLEDMLDEIDDSPEVTMDELQSMSKIELELLGREHGIELDRRKRKADLIIELKKIKKVGI